MNFRKIGMLAVMLAAAFAIGGCQSATKDEDSFMVQEELASDGQPYRLISAEVGGGKTAGVTVAVIQEYEQGPKATGRWNTIAEASGMSEAGRNVVVAATGNVVAAVGSALVGGLVAPDTNISMSQNQGQKQGQGQEQTSYNENENNAYGGNIDCGKKGCFPPPPKPCHGNKCGGGHTY